ncbi:MAG: BatA domain-containing protein, partial [Planctomycetota bacterium]
MTFLNALLALGAMAFSIPLIIHLLNRSRYLTVDWGAMQFLESSVRVNARRIQWKQLLLLLIRCLIPVVLALAMARPIILSWRDSGAANAMALAVVLDDSMSMQTIDEPDGNSRRNRWRIACDQLTEIADQLPTGSTVCLVLAGSPPEMYGDLDTDACKDQLERLSQQTTFAGKFDLVTSLERGLDWLQQASHSKRHLVVVSDFASSDWSSGPESPIEGAQQRIAGQSVPVPWSFLNVAKRMTEDESRSDTAIKTMEIAPRVATVGAPLTVTASLQNFSSTPQQVPVRLSADGDEIEMQSLTVPARSTLTTRFRWIPKSQGDAELKVELGKEDRAPADNSITRVMRVMDPVRVLLVDGGSRDEAMRSESDFLRYALTPFALLQGLPGDVFSTRVVDPNGWDQATLREQDLVVCCNVPDLPVPQRQWLLAFV